MQWWLTIAHFFGTRNGDGNSSGYLSWSGVLSDVGQLTIAGGLIAIVRKHNCEVHGCWRVGRHKTAADHMVCRKHHPDDRLTAEAVAAAHEEALTQ